MKSTGMVRKIDGLGRLVIPKELRRINDIDEGASIEIFIGNDNNIVLRKYISSCSLCGKTSTTLNSYLKAHLCDKCFKLISQAKKN
jgi:transcriptional pleiotropic regulator of transition state genes